MNFFFININVIKSIDNGVLSTPKYNKVPIFILSKSLLPIFIKVLFGIISVVVLPRSIAISYLYFLIKKIYKAPN
ncbi:MAG: hypothetical protein CM15mP93_09810 [Thiotrichaceae bacterium]|nr:MAG: hypothetical protein CM15mP93_09810 [Thiotrichaceae bacterium]